MFQVKRHVADRNKVCFDYAKHDPGSQDEWSRSLKPYRDFFTTLAQNLLKQNFVFPAVGGFYPVFFYTGLQKSGFRKQL